MRPDGRTGELWRDDGIVATTNGLVTLKPYGWLRGFTLEFRDALENMDASNPYDVTVTLRRFRDLDALEVPIRVQTICESVAPLTEYDSAGARPLLWLPTSS